MAEVLFMEDELEKIFIREIQNLGYTYVPQQEIVRKSLKSPLAEEMMRDSLVRINPEISSDIIERAIYLLSNIDAGLLASRNEIFFDYLQNGIEVSHYEHGKQKTSRVYLLDTENVENNSFVVTNQLTIIGKEQKRPDIILFINGFPLVVIELKSAFSLQSDIHSAYRQIRNYQHDIEELFVYNAFNIISDFTHTKVGTITSHEEWYKEWKTKDSKDNIYVNYKTLIDGVLDKNRIIDILTNFIIFEHKESKVIKIMAQYHQYYAVHKAKDSTLKAIENKDGRGGVFWHTQGSGKSLSMVFYTQLMMKSLKHPTFIILTDRNDLDDQLYGQFSRVKNFLRQEPIQAQSRYDLKELLSDRRSNGIFFTTMQKFAESEEPLTPRDDVIVIADEAHRSQYGLREKIGRDGKVQSGMARLVRQSLPNATYIGFTGTPLSQNDKDTQEIFGHYIDIYDMTQSVADGATKPVYYENRVINLNLNDELLKEIDAKYDDLADEAHESVIEESKRELSRLEVILGSDQAIDTLVKDILTHYEESRAGLLTGKAMIVAYNRRIAIKIYQRILELRPNWNEKVKVVMTGNNNDPEEWKDIIGSKSDRDDLARKFKDNDDSMKIAIVVDMWLTGFDVPSLATMYIYKPMKGHNLMQAIARVNRVFEDKEGGLVVDYIGIAKALKEAMSDYTTADQKAIDNADIRDSAYPKFKEKLEVCRNVYFNGFNYSQIFSQSITSENLSKLIADGINHVIALNEEKLKNFTNDAYALKQAHSLCSSITSKEEQREAGYFEAIRISVNRIRRTEKLSKEDINAQISELLEQSIHSEGVINLFTDFDKGFSLFDPNFLGKIEKMEQKNLSIELLNKLLKDEIKAISRHDIVKGKEFSERLRAIMKRYKDGQVDNAESLDRFAGMDDIIQTETSNYETDDLQRTRKALVDLAKEAMESQDEHIRLGLTRAELAFYHAIANPENVQDFYTNEELIQLTKELTKAISEEMTADWELKQSGRANVRRTIKRLLKRYKYPGNYKEAIDLVVKQAEYWDGMQMVSE
ncbi:type I restriction endonuclease subunit R [Fundicoccus culcitae]|uniref:Type I restriction enzyme endonuclease subunit n=1 Tax=Fundicoccus culcitae TaxID=2969821 RepID=A0ABY5P3P4_9LACT|nr:type I restriction endonuclease subunit R [Fundicoccus culcitae]UUX33353.1 type I restriction endonuclease subunit R [Fundicoccus culcitae]